MGAAEGDGSLPRPLDELGPDDRELVEAARRARERAHAPYSRFRVGAAARTADGAVHLGCNVEISSYGLTLCAERLALFAARAAGADRIDRLAVVGPGHGDAPTPPCGACRQVIWDLAPDATLLLATPTGAVLSRRPADLLPEPFGPADLVEDAEMETTEPTDDD